MFTPDRTSNKPLIPGQGTIPSLASRSILFLQNNCHHSISITMFPCRNERLTSLMRLSLRRHQEDRPAVGSRPHAKTFIEGTAVALARAASKDFYFDSWEIHKCEPEYFNS